MSRTYSNKKDKEQAKRRKDARKDALRIRGMRQQDYAMFIERRGC